MESCEEEGIGIHCTFRMMAFTKFGHMLTRYVHTLNAKSLHVCGWMFMHVYYVLQCVEPYTSLSLSLPPSAELTQQELDVIPVTQSTYMQKNKLKFLLGKVDQLLGITPDQRKWTIKGRKSVSIA